MNAADVLAKQEIARLDERIVAAQRLALTDGSISDAERSRFALYINKLQARRAEIEAALQDPAAGDGDEMSDMTEARVNNVEATLRTMDDRLTRIVEQIHQLDVRTGRLEDAVNLLKDGQRATAEQMRSLGQRPIYSRMYLAAGALAMTVVIVLLLIVTWRLL